MGKTGWRVTGPLCTAFVTSYVSIIISKFKKNLNIDIAVCVYIYITEKEKRERGNKCGNKLTTDEFPWRVSGAHILFIQFSTDLKNFKKFQKISRILLLINCGPRCCGSVG